MSESFRVKSVLVTGATGFIGRYLITTLSQRQELQISAATRRPVDLPLRSGCVGNIDGDTDWRSVLQGIDVVIHLAARAHVLHEDGGDPEAEFFTVNTVGTLNLAKQAIAAGVKHFILVSSGGAMATLSDRPLDETAACQPDTPYGRSKLQAEIELQRLCADSSMTWTILRPTLVYGPGNPGNMAALLKLVNQGLPLPLRAIRNRRSLLYIGNLVDVVHRCIDDPAAQNQTFLVSDDEVVSTPDLIRQIGQAMGKPPHLSPVPPMLLIALAKFLGQGERIARLTGSLEVSNHHLQRTLKWSPPYSFRQGMQNTVDCFVNSSVSL